MLKWTWILGLIIGIPLLLYLFGYFWTKGSMVAKKDFIDNSIIGPTDDTNYDSK